MPLPPPAERTPMHRRIIDCSGYMRSDGLWDIEGRLTDTKAYDIDNEWRGTIPAGTPVHDMHVRFTVDDDFTIVDVAVAMEGAPFGICADVMPDFQPLKGQTIARGWNRTLGRLFSGARGCTHVVELMGRLGTVAYHTIIMGKKRRRALTGGADAEPAGARGQKPFMIDTCHAWASDGPLVKKYYPDYYRDPEDEAAPPAASGTEGSKS